MASDSAAQTELWCRTLDPPGSFLFGLRLVPTGPGQFTIIGRDITAQDAASRKQRAGQALLARVFAAVNIAIAVTDWQDTLLMTNPHFDRLHGRDPGALTGTSLVQLLAPAARDAMVAARVNQSACSAADRGADVEHPVQTLRQDGTVIEGTLRAVVTEHGADRFRIVTLTPSTGGLFRVAGNIRLIGLDDVRRAAGTGWAAMAERAMTAAEHVIERALAPGDTYSRTDDAAFLVCFASAVEEEARFRAAIIARDIRAKLMGDGADAASSQVTALVSTVDATGTSLQDVPDHLNNRLGDRRAGAERQARQVLMNALTNVRCATTSITDRTGQPVATLVDIPAATQVELSNALTLLPDTAAAGFDLNVLLLTLLIEQAPRLPGLQAGGPVLLPVDLDLLHRPGHTARLLALLGTLPGPVRFRLTILIGHLRLEQGPRRVLGPMQQLRSHCRDVGFSLIQPELPPSALTLACGSRSPLVSLPAARLLRPDRERITHFITALHGRGGVLLALGATPDDRAALLEIGVDWMAGA